MRTEWIPIAFAAVLALILAAAFVTWSNASEVPKATDRVLHTLDVQKELQRTGSAMLQAETTHRAVVLTGKPEYLARFNDLVSEANGEIERLASITSDNPVQQTNVAALKSTWQQKLTEMRTVIQTRTERGLSAAAQRVGQGYGVELMEHAQAIMEDMLAEESRLLARRNSQTEVSRQRAAVSYLVSTSVGVALLVGLAVLFTRIAALETKRREEEAAFTASLQKEIEEKDRARESEARLLEELQRSNRELQDFAFVASHDLQEPLRKIIAFGDRVKRKEADRMTPEGLDYLQRSMNAAARMQGLIESLLDFSRVTSKAQPLVPTDLNHVLDDVTEDLQSRIERTGGEVRVGKLPTVDADATQMRQLFQNLIGNALKFAREGEPPVVHVDAEKLAGGGWKLRVADNGIGFDPRYADKIFTIFQRLHGRGEYEGNGIGLAIVRKIVERHGGNISAHSEPGQGATFEIVLPARKADRTRT